jgi:hypothetical protein
MKVPRQVWWLAGLAVLVCALTALLRVSGEETSKGDFLGLRHSSYSNSPGGLRALYLTLQELGYHPRRGRMPFSAMTLPDRGTVVVAEPLAAVTAAEWRALLTWVEAGHGLFLASEISLPHSKWISPGSSILVEPELTRARPCQPSHLARAVRAVAIRSRTRLAFPEPPSRSGDKASKDKQEAGEVELPPGPWGKVGHPRDVSEVLAGAAPIFRDKEGTVAAYARAGGGEIVLFSSPWSLSNAGLAKGDNLTFVLNVLGAAADGEVVFDEYHQGYGKNSLWALTPLPLKVGLGQLLVGMLVVMYARSRRFGRVIPLEREGRERREFLETMTALLQKGEATRLAVRLAEEGATARLRVDLGLAPGAGAGELAEAAGRMEAAAGERLGRALAECRRTRESGRAPSANRAMSLVRELDEAVEQVRKL